MKMPNQIKLSVRDKELLYYASKIKHHCENSNCSECIFYDNGYCGLISNEVKVFLIPDDEFNLPQQWDITSFMANVKED